ncbi:MAG TPA: c-type cytochrome [Gemmatimonadaceae bacterium]|nr:c-type cytochrome [Gemmatimonadaceae bacterium]
MKILRRILIGLVALIVLLLVTIYALSAMRLNRTYDVSVAPLSVSPANADTAEGHRWAAMRGCTQCHGENLGGTQFADDFPFGRVGAPNITRGRGSPTAAYADSDWVRAVRHGINREGKPLFIMPSHEYNGLSDRDLSAVIAYVRSAPPIDSALPPRRLGPVARALVGFGAMPLAAALIDHGARPTPPPPGATMEYGRYLVGMCTPCHGQNLGGLTPGGHGPPPGPNITKGGALAAYTKEAFARAIRTGQAPTRPLNGELMPWPAFSRLTDDEVEALWMYISSVAPVTAAVRE